MLPKFNHLRPKTVNEALAVLNERPAMVHGGGTDLLGCLREGVFSAETLVSLSFIDELKGIRTTGDGGLRIGALTTVAEVADSDHVAASYAGLAQAASEVASPQLRNQGTIGGNLCQKPRCWYYRGHFDCLRKGGDICFAVDGQNQYHCIFGGDMCFIVHPSDTAPALAALGAVCRISGPATSRSVAVESFHVPTTEDPRRETVLDPDEIVTEIVLPAPADTVSSARVFLSGAAPVPWRSKATEEVITGTTLDDATIAKAAAATVAGAEPLEHNGYKVPLFEGVMKEELKAIKK
jgi:xanthine dehydrogenase YagS FAD-binding subunit